MRTLLQSKSYTINLFFISLFFSCNFIKSSSDLANITKTKILQLPEGYRISLNGEPFYIKGAGLDKGSIDAVKEHGGNSIRTWNTENAKAVLDRAQELGLKVMMGIWIGLERHGFDYNDEEAVKRQYEEIKADVLALKDHPALIIWGVGNEINHLSKNPKVWDAVNDISKMIHELDPHHLTTTSIAGIDEKDVDLVNSRASDLDFLSIQLYGPIDKLPQLIERSSYKGPLLITEWGATGWWEVQETKWGAPIENHSSKKADLYLSRYRNSILSQSQQVMGSFVFLWGQKQERTPTWFGMFMANGNETESVDAMHYAWNGTWPENRSPRLLDLKIVDKQSTDDIELIAGQRYSAKVSSVDPENDPLFFRWEIMRESRSKKTGGDPENIPETLEGLFISVPDSVASFTSPIQGGAYRLFVYVEDRYQHTAHANIPFFVREN